MARKPVTPDQHRQRPVDGDGPDDGLFRARLRDADDSRQWWSKLGARLKVVSLWITAVAAGVYLLRDAIVGAVRFLSGGQQ